MIRPLLTLAALALISVTATADTIRLGDRNGGYVKQHIDTAKVWLKHRDSLILTGDQISAAAIQVAWFRAHGGKVCAYPGRALYFHDGALGTNPTKRYLGYSLKPGWYSPGDFGIKPCLRQRNSRVKLLKF